MLKQSYAVIHILIVRANRLLLMYFIFCRIINADIHFEDFAFGVTYDPKVL